MTANGPVNFPLLESSANNHSIVRTWLMFYAFDRKTNNVSIRRTLHVEKGTTGKQAANVALSRCRQTSADVRFCAAATTAAAAAALSPSCRRLRAAAAAIRWLVVAFCPPSDFVIVMRPSTLSLPATFADKLSSTAATATTVVELTVVHWRRKHDDLLVDKAGIIMCYYSSGGAFVASRRLPLQRFAMVGCCVLC